jgi:hypothetical protein
MLLANMPNPDAEPWSLTIDQRDRTRHRAIDFVSPPLLTQNVMASRRNGPLGTTCVPYWMSARLALNLEANHIGTAELWLKMQMRYDLEQAREEAS